jgi:hypothetical protein
MSDKKVKNIIALNNVTLESTEAATQAATSRAIIDTYFSDQLNFTVKYTTGASETVSDCYVKVWGYVGVKSEGTSYPYGSGVNSEIAADSDNWIQIGTYDLSSGTATFTPSLYKVAGGAGGTTYNSHFAHGITFSKIRFSAYETGVVVNKGTLTLIASIQ